MISMIRKSANKWLLLVHEDPYYLCGVGEYPSPEHSLRLRLIQGYKVRCSGPGEPLKVIYFCGLPVPTRIHAPNTGQSMSILSAIGEGVSIGFTLLLLAVSQGRDWILGV